MKFVAFLLFSTILSATNVLAHEVWRGLVVAPENRCAPYNSRVYRYPQSVEDLIVAKLGGVYAPYTGRWFDSDTETDIEHIVARSEAHDSGLCDSTSLTKRKFSTDLLNLTLAGPRVNRHQKVDKDAADWLPPMNKCWYVSRIVAVKQRYNLTVDLREAMVLSRILNSCTFTETKMVVLPSEVPIGALDLYDDNENGRISCREARSHGIAPVKRGHPAYAFMRDGNRDGVVC